MSDKGDEPEAEPEAHSLIRFLLQSNSKLKYPQDLSNRSDKPKQKRTHRVAFGSKATVMYNTHKTCLREVMKPKHRHTH